MLKSQEFMPFIVFVAAPSVEALKVMYEEGRHVRGGRVSAGQGMSLFQIWGMSRNLKFFMFVKKSRKRTSVFFNILEILEFDSFAKMEWNLCLKTFSNILKVDLTE